MDPERWKQVDELLQSALLVSSEGRGKFLHEACAGDAALEQEVRSLLSSHAEAGSFLESAAMHVAARGMALGEAHATVDFVAGQMISHYRVLRKLGSGGMGVVYEAEDTRLGRRLALKFLSEPLTGDAKALERFQREARTASALNHPNICTVYEIDQSEDLHFIAIEFLEGETLKERLARRHELAPQEIFTIANGICHALDAAHSAGIIHRDIKPANIFLTRQGTVKVLDFGVAKQKVPLMTERSTRPSLSTPDISDHTSTNPTATVGTVGYMSPEQANGHNVDARTDIFSLGAVLYEMASGVQPFLARNPADDVQKIQDENPRPISQLNPDVPSGLCRVIEKAMQTDPSFRYQNAEEMLLELRSAEERSRTRRAKQKMAFVLMLIGVLLLIVVALFRVPRAREWIANKLGSNSTRKINSLAVLPLENLTGDASQEYFSDGMTDALIAQLAQLPGLRVISRTSTIQYKGTHKTIPEIARELQVDAIVEGTVTRSSDKTKITVEVIDAPSDVHLWAGSVSGSQQDTLLLQGEVAEEIAFKIGSRVSPDKGKQLPEPASTDPEAYDAYLRGEYLRNKRTPDDTREAIRYFQRAIARDPSFAAAYGHLSDCYLQLAITSEMPSAEADAAARDAVEKAVSLDDHLDQAHTALAAITWREWQWKQSEAEFKRAILRNPNSAPAHLYYSELLLVLGRPRESSEEEHTAMTLDPISLDTAISSVLNSYLRGTYDEGLVRARFAIELYPEVPVLHDLLANIYVQQGQENLAAAEILAAEEYGGAIPRRMAALRAANSQGRLSGLRRKRIDLNERLAALGTPNDYDIAIDYAALGNKEGALRWLEKGLQTHDTKMPYIAVEPIFDGLRNDPRFLDLLHQMGLSSTHSWTP